jgi:hypothetical protein
MIISKLLGGGGGGGGPGLRVGLGGTTSMNYKDR